MPPPEHRLIVVVPLLPAAQFAAFRAWFRANVVQPGDDDDDPATWPGLNAVGDAGPATHRWWSGALPDAILRPVMVRMCQLAAVTPPTAQVWAGWTRAQKVTWLVATRASLRAATGIYLDLSGQVGGNWTSPEAILAAVGLKRQRVGA